MKRRGMTRADVLALGAIMLVLGLLVPALLADAKKAGQERAYCAANLRGIAQSLIVYSAENNDDYPCYTPKSAVTYDPTLKESLGKNAAEKTMDGIYKDELFPNNPLAPLWLLVLRNQTSPKQFICRSDPFAGKVAGLQKGEAYYQNFQDGKNISYSVAYPWWTDKKGKPAIAAWWKNTTDSSLPIMSDMAPYLSAKAAAGEASSRPTTAPTTAPEGTLILGKPETTWSLETATSPNHEYVGMNVVFADAHAEFARRPDIGQSNDNIWAMTVKNKEVTIDAGELPAKMKAMELPYDIVMVPTRSAKGELK